MAFSNRSFDYSGKHLIPCVVMDDPPNEKTDGAVGALCIDKESITLSSCEEFTMAMLELSKEP